MIRDEVNVIVFFGFLTVLICVTIIGYNIGYKNGQIDALNGELNYKLVQKNIYVEVEN